VRQVGAVAQLGARLNGIQKVRGSNPLSSIISSWKTGRNPCTARENRTLQRAPGAFQNSILEGILRKRHSESLRDGLSSAAGKPAPTASGLKGDGTRPARRPPSGGAPRPALKQGSNPTSPHGQVAENPSRKATAPSSTAGPDKVQCLIPERTEAPEDEARRLAIQRSAIVRHPVRPPAAVTIADLERYAEEWLFEGECRSHSAHTIGTRRSFIKHLLWFLQQKGHQACDTRALKEFLVYLAQPHPEGRWGIPRMTQPLRPISQRDYFQNLKIMFKWFEGEGLVVSSPLARVQPQVVRASQVQPFAPEQVAALLRAARKSCHPRRDYAILMVLLDTGLRAMELCGLRVRDIDLQAGCVSVTGKGNKRRTVFFGEATAKALRQHLRSEARLSDDWVFLSDRGIHTGRPLKPNGLLQLMERLGRSAGIQAVRCSPHTCRHTYAVSFLRAGGSAFTLRESLGHTTLTMTSKYVVVAEADLSQSRMFSPMDRLSVRSFEPSEHTDHEKSGRPRGATR